MAFTVADRRFDCAEERQSFGLFLSHLIDKCTVSLQLVARLDDFISFGVIDIVTGCGELQVTARRLVGIREPELLEIRNLRRPIVEHVEFGCRNKEGKLFGLPSLTYATCRLTIFHSNLTTKS